MATFHQLLNALDEPMLEINAMGRVVFLTTRAEAMLGITVGENVTSAVSSWCRPKFEHALDRIREGVTLSTTVEISFGEDNVAATTLEAKLASVARDGAKSMAVAMWLRDLSQEKAHENAALVQGSHLLDLVETTSDGCVIESATGTVEMVNVAFCVLFGINAAPQSLIGMSCLALFVEASRATGTDDAPDYPELDESASAERGFPLKDGRSVMQYIHPAEGDTGIAGRLHVFRLKGKRDLPDARAGTITAAQMLLMERIAEDLALTVEGTGRAIRRTEQIDLPSTVANQFRYIANAASSALTAISDLLDFSRVESNLITLDVIEFGLRSHIAIMLDRVVPAADARNVQLRVRIEQDVPERLVGDGPRLMLCLRSLLESAMPPVGQVGGGELTLSIAPEYASEEVIHLRFGIEHACPKGVVRQKSLSSANTMQIALARQIARALAGDQGEGKIEQRERKDAIEFHFTAAMPYQRVSEAFVRPNYFTLTGLPLLIVSPDANERHMLAQHCQSWRLLPREADNAEMALFLLTNASRAGAPIPLVITSNTLPVQDGFLLAFRIRHHPALSTTAIMMLAKTGRQGDAIACQENNINAYLRHPIASVQLNEAISAVMGAGDDLTASHKLITRHSLREAKSGAVLLIDPVREHSGIVAQSLKRLDYRVVVAETADHAFAALQQDVFDLIIIDPETPGLSPRSSAATQIKKRLDNRNAETKFVLATSLTEDVKDAGYDGRLEKPYDKEALKRTILEHCPAKRVAPPEMTQLPSEQ